MLSLNSENCKKCKEQNQGSDWTFSIEQGLRVWRGTVVVWSPKHGQGDLADQLRQRRRRLQSAGSFRDEIRLSADCVELLQTN